jgi:3-hydroxyacyl-[acyl-carrier-protein] dehydratase
MPLPDSDSYVALLPHRPPFRFVDSVDQVVPATYIEARYRVTGEEPFLAGHFPGNPVLPGVIQLEALAQAGAITLLCDGRYAGKLALFGGVEKVRFRRIVRPGDELLLVVEIERLSARAGWGAAKATVDGEVACEGRMLFAVSEQPG